ncbi:MAG: Xaa-Pro peptidase family protein [bacterium]|jgi:Xaa-Pro aminopeptidase|nr:Xaa-Pro peptidase family protein [candidate division KSB1 bacterium]MDH7560153.1 Xaa-Pro peptidase family protein [bacterium]
MALVQEKIAQAIAILQEQGVDMWLIFVRESGTMPDPCLELVVGTSCTWQSAFIITTRGDTLALVGSLDVANQKEHGYYREVIGYQESIRPHLLQVLDRLAPRSIAINFSESDNMADGLTHGMYLLLQKYLEGTPYRDRLLSSERIVAALRGRKSATEQEAIGQAVELTLRMFDAVGARLRPGLSEKEVAQLLLDEVAAHGVELAWDPEMCPSVFTGPESAGAHAGPTERRIAPGHLMNIDFGIKCNGYCSDLQRTWYFLRPGERQAPEVVRRGFAAVRDAIQLASQALTPGAECWTVDDVARRHIVACGFEEYPHALGHQIGRKAHDGAGILCPRWERYGNRPYELVEEGQVYTLEPRVTVPDHGVATIEEVVVVHKDGCTFLSAPQQELYLVPA